MTTQPSAARMVDDKFEIDPASPAFYFDIAPVLDRCPASMRNPERLKLSCEHCAQRVAPSEMILFKDNGFFLVVQSCVGAAAEGVARAVNMALVKHFFGSESVAGQDTIFRAVAFDAIAQAGFAITAPAAAAAAISHGEQAPSDPLIRLAESGVRGYDGLRLAFQPVFNVQRATASIYFCGPTRQQGAVTLFGSAALGSTNIRDRPAIDEAILEHGLNFVRRIVPARAAAAIGVSVSFETLARSGGRQLYQKALRVANVADNPFLIVKIDDIPTGTPVTRLAEIVSIIRPFAKRVFLQLPDCDIGVMQGGNMGVAGLAMALPTNAPLPVIARSSMWLSRAAAAQQAQAYLENVDRGAVLQLARSTGIRFASGQGCDNGPLLNEPPINSTEHALNPAPSLACA